ncbi:MAG: general secretion pathway protein GspK [Gammaproteobacteria bacterium]|nr:general secretion pathway protein GspK [Gammaproteobacteria bacterium]MYF37672.1 general secretion pathway protein GspK [Gammaproteobacteria bacterium]
MHQDRRARKNRSSSTRRSRTKGVALLGVLAIVGVSGMLAYQLVSLQSVSIAHVRLTKNYDQLLAYTSGLEELLSARLLYDWLEADDRPYDNYEEDWASTDIDVEFSDVEDSTFNIRVFDLQAQFNANSLNDPDSLIAGGAFSELCSNFSLPYDAAPKIRDWIDDDESIQPSGGEDFEYSRYDPPFRTPNQLAADLSEFNYFLDFNEEETEFLRKHVALTPTNQLVVNINTVSEPVLEALLKSVDVHENVSSLIGDDRDFTDVESLIAAYPYMEALRPNLAISSNFFRLEGTVSVPNLGRIDFTTEFFRHPDTGDVTIYKRDFGKRHTWEELDIY